MLKAVLPVVCAIAAIVAAIPAETLAAAPPPPAEMAGIPVSLLVDSNSGQVLYARQPNLRFVPASMAKVMTLYVALEEIQQGRLTADKRFTVSDATARLWNGRGTSLYLRGGQSVSVDELLHGISTVSANDASVVLAEGQAGSVAGWTALMNAQAQRLGMRHSHFATPNGWPDESATYVSAADLVKLGNALVTRYPSEYRRYVGQKQMVWEGVTLQSHDPTLGVVNGADGIKTGHTAEAGYNFLGSAARGGRRLMMVVAGAHSEAERAVASRALLEWGFNAWQAQPLFAAGSTVAQAQVQGGNARTVPLVAEQNIDAFMPVGVAQPVTLRVDYRGPLVAPIAKGAAVAHLVISIDGRISAEVTLKAGKSVSQASLLNRLLNGLYGILA